jgi:hypothetical protein
MFPFLTFDDTSSVGEWEFLEIFGVGVEINLDFCLEVLRRLKETESTFSYKIYEEIQRKLWTSADQDADADRIRYGGLNSRHRPILDLRLTEL